MDIAVPFVFLFYCIQFNQEVHLAEDYTQLDFSFEHFGIMKPKMAQLMPEINSDWLKVKNSEGLDAFV